MNENRRLKHERRMIKLAKMHHSIEEVQQVLSLFTTMSKAATGLGAFAIGKMAQHDEKKEQSEEWVNAVKTNRAVASLVDSDLLRDAMKEQTQAAHAADARITFGDDDEDIIEAEVVE